MAEYIEREAVLLAFGEEPLVWTDSSSEFQERNDWRYYKGIVEEAPAADVVPRAALEQIMWERDVAMEQLKEHGIPFGGKAEPVNQWVNIAHEHPPCRGHYFIAYKFQGSEMRFYGEAFWHDDIPDNGYVKGNHFSNEGVDGMYVTHWMKIPKLTNCGAKMDLEG